MFTGLVILMHFAYVHLRWVTPLVSHIILARMVAFCCTTESNCCVDRFYVSRTRTRSSNLESGARNKLCARALLVREILRACFVSRVYFLRVRKGAVFGLVFLTVTLNAP